MTKKSNLNKRWFYLASGMFTMLFSGVLYAWSILKIPFKGEFGWSDSVLAFNFTLTMCFFCLGAFFGSLICKKAGVTVTLILAGLLVGAGFVTTGLLGAGVPYLLYLTYAVLAGTGIGISMAANKVKGIRAACCSDFFSAKYTRVHNDANVLCMGARVIGAGLACELVDVFINTEFEGGRHKNRIDML